MLDPFQLRFRCRVRDSAMVYLHYLLLRIGFDASGQEFASMEADLNCFPLRFGARHHYISKCPKTFLTLSFSQSLKIAFLQEFRTELYTY